MIRRNNRRNPNAPLIDGLVATDSNTMERGINATAAPTMRGSVLDSLNMDVAEDGGMVIRDPLILKHRVKRTEGVLKTRLLETHVKHIMLYVEDNKLYLLDTSNRDNTPQSFNIIWFDRYNNSHAESSESPSWEFENIEVTSTGTSTLISNVSLVPIDFDDMEVYQDSSISVFRIMRLELDSQTGNFLKCTLLQPITPNISVGDDFSYNPNTYHDYPYALRDSYDTEVISTVGIVSYMLGTENADKTEFTPYTGHATAAALYNYLKNNNFKVRDITEMNINHLGALGTFRPIIALSEADRNKPIVLKAFLSFPNAALEHLKYMGIWEKTYDGITWEPLSYTGRNIPKISLLVDKENLVDIKDAAETTETITGEIMVYNNQYDLVANRADVITVIPDGATYRFRVFNIPEDIYTSNISNISFNETSGIIIESYPNHEVATKLEVDSSKNFKTYMYLLNPADLKHNQFNLNFTLNINTLSATSTDFDNLKIILKDSLGNEITLEREDLEITSITSTSFNVSILNPANHLEYALNGIYLSLQLIIKVYFNNALTAILKTILFITKPARQGTHKIDKTYVNQPVDQFALAATGRLAADNFETRVTGESGPFDFCNAEIKSDLDNDLVFFDLLVYKLTPENYTKLFNAGADNYKFTYPEIKYSFTVEDTSALTKDWTGWYSASSFHSMYNDEDLKPNKVKRFYNVTIPLSKKYVAFRGNSGLQVLEFGKRTSSSQEGWENVTETWGYYTTVSNLKEYYLAAKRAKQFPLLYKSKNAPPLHINIDLTHVPSEFIEERAVLHGNTQHSILITLENEIILNDLPNIAKGKFIYYKKSLYAYGHIDFQNNVYVSNANSFEFPLFNVIDLNTPASNIATAIVPWRDYLIVTTETSVFMVSGSAPSFIITLVNGFIGVPLKDGPTVKAILNGIIFKSGEKVFTLQPSVYSAADNTLYIQEISTPVNRYLQLFNTGDTSFGIVTDRHYILFSGTNALKFDLNQKIWTRHSFPNPVHNVLYTSVSDNYIISENQDVTGDTFAYIAHYGRKLQDFIGDSEEDKRLPHIDYLNYFDEYDIMDILKDNSIAIRIPFKVNFGQKTSNMALIKQFVESKITFRLSSTDSRQDAFEIKLDVYTDENKKPIHVIATTDGKLLQEIEYGLYTPVDVKYVGVLNTDFQDTSDVSADVDTTLKQIVVRHSGKGKSIQHIISGESAYNFKIYVIYYKYKIVPIHH